MGRKLFVGNLAFSMGEAELKQLFEEKGGVESVTVMRDMDTGRSRGFGFIEMPDDTEALNVIKTVNGGTWEGKKIIVRKAFK